MVTRVTEDVKGEYIFSLGGGLQWASERRFAREMRLRVSTFRKLCRALKVPMVCARGTERIVCVPVFMIAMWAVSRIGQPDFVVPGCDELRRGAKHWQGRQFVNELDLGYLEKVLGKCVEELAAVRKIKGQEMSSGAMTVAREAAKRMVEMLAHTESMRKR